MANKILVLDDEENYAQMVYDLLRSHRYACEMVTMPQEALKRIKEDDYGLIVSDYKMPSMNGLDFLISARKINPKQPVIMVSGLMNTPELLQAANKEVTLVLEKPFKTAEFLRNVSRFVDPLPEEVDLDNAGAGGPGGQEDEGRSERQAESLELTYPRPLQHLSDASAMSMDFVQALWERARRSECMFLAAGRGSEFELVLRELSRWKKSGDGRVLVFTPAQLLSPKVESLLDTVPDDTGTSNVIGVTGIDDLSYGQQDELMRFIKGRSDAKGKDKRLFFVFRVFDEEFPVGGGKERTTLQERMNGQLLYLPPLSERLADVAVYACRYLKLFAKSECRPAKAKLTEEAQALLLAHNWPGNFEELVEALRRAVQLGEESATGRPEVQTMLQRLHEAPMDTEASLNFKDFVASSQRKYFEHLLRLVSNDEAAALRVSKVEQDAVSNGTSIKELDVLYPELLKS